MRSLALQWLCLLSVPIACQRSASVTGDVPPPRIASVSPDAQEFGAATRVAVTGENFFVKATRRLSSGDAFAVDDEFILTLGTRGKGDGAVTALSDIRYIDSESISGRVPPTLPPGTYSVTMTTPHGTSVTVVDAFTVWPPRNSDTASEREVGSDRDTASDSGSDSETTGDSESGVGTDSEFIPDSDTGQDTDTGSASAPETDDSDTGTGSLDTAGSGMTRVALTFRNQAQSEDLVDFPVLVILDSTRIDHTQTSDNGRDVHFRDADGRTPLAHEIEHWDPAGTSYIWVRVPQIDGGSGTDSIWMYYGDPSAAPPSEPSAVWENGYQAVYHLDTAADAAGNLGPADILGPTSSDAGIAGSLLFDGVDDYVSLGTELPLLQSVEACTLSAWIRPATGAPYRGGDAYIVGVSVNTDGESTLLSRAALYLTREGGVALAGRSQPTEEMRSVESAGRAVVEGVWQHVVGVIDYRGDEMRLYVDGAEVATGTADFTRPATFPGSVRSAVIGVQEDYSSAFFQGNIDEARIAGVGRSGDWIAAQHLSLTDRFIAYGHPEPAR